MVPDTLTGWRRWLALFRELRKANGSHYDTRTRKVTIVPGSPLFVWYHEAAHAVQHARRTPRFLFWFWGARYVGWLRRVAHLLIELEANRIAEEEMRRVGKWNADCRALSRLLIARYVLWLVVP